MRKITTERDTLQERMASASRQLQDVRADNNKYRGLHSKLVVALSEIKTEAKTLISAHKEDVAAIDAHTERLSKGAKRVKTLEKRVVALFASRDVPRSGLEDDENGSGAPRG